MMRYTVITVKDLMLEEFEKDIEKVCQNKILLMQSGSRKEVFLLSKELYKTYEKLGKNVYMTGFYMGEIRKKFKVSIEFGEKLAQVNTTRRIWINRKGEQRFLYGRNINKEYVTRKDEIKEDQKVLILNQNNDYLGLGILRRSGDVKNVLDKGWYLRRKE
ncbi:MAG: hypothetical protein GOU97_00450 [Nanoarchaeota archaeon]|nr:hypothetical protein [Nanoarchaeota archaeon]